MKISWSVHLSGRAPEIVGNPKGRAHRKVQDTATGGVIGVGSHNFLEEFKEWLGLEEVLHSLAHPMSDKVNATPTVKHCSAGQSHPVTDMLLKMITLDLLLTAPRNSAGWPATGSADPIESISA
jgi:hypothetical protein